MSAESLSALSAHEREALLALARQSIVAHLAQRATPPTSDLPPRLQAPQDAFVTLHIDGHLRGCIGMVEADKPLCEVVTHCAVNAATQDPRFPPLTLSEMECLRIEISALSPPVTVDSPHRIEPGRHGVIVSRGRQQGLLLPQVAIEHGWDRTALLRQTCRKAGLKPDAWEHGARLQIFEAAVFAETNRS